MGSLNFDISIPTRASNYGFINTRQESQLANSDGYCNVFVLLVIRK
jgi:hypothetical protein